MFVMASEILRPTICIFIILPTFVTHPQIRKQEGRQLGKIYKDAEARVQPLTTTSQVKALNVVVH